MAIEKNQDAFRESQRVAFEVEKDAAETIRRAEAALADAEKLVADAVHSVEQITNDAGGAVESPSDAAVRNVEEFTGEAGGGVQELYEEEVGGEETPTGEAIQGMEEPVGEPVPEADELDDAGWQLTLAQWNLGRKEFSERQWMRQTAMTVAAVAMIAYLFYRAVWTLNLVDGWAAAFSILLLAAECYAGFSLLLYFFQVWRLVEPPLRRPTERRTVDVFVTTYNEDVSLLRGTLTACMQMDYPHATYVLDDGAREEVRDLARNLGIRYISRTDRSNAKAGNLNNALRQTDGEFVIILDADHIPYRHYISRLIGYFDDPRMGFVQAPHTTYNLDNFMGRWKSTSKAYWEDVRIFFEAVQLGKNRFEVACFCGSAAMFRRKALEEVGLFATETITEDMHTGMRINAAGWKSLAVGRGNGRGARAGRCGDLRQPAIAGGARAI